MDGWKRVSRSCRPQRYAEGDQEAGILSHEPVTFARNNLTNTFGSRNMTIGESPYYAYLIRLRRVDNAGHPVWRISLESPRRGEQRTFADLHELFAFLRGCIEQGGEAPERSQEDL